MTEQGIVFGKINAGVVDKYKAVDAECAVGVFETRIAADIAGEAQIRCELESLRLADACIFVILVVIASWAVI